MMQRCGGTALSDLAVPMPVVTADIDMEGATSFRMSAPPG
jgi:hypothetical protein